MHARQVGALAAMSVLWCACSKPLLKRDETTGADQPIRVRVQSLVVDGDEVSKQALAPLLHDALLQHGLDTYIDETDRRSDDAVMFVRVACGTDDPQAMGVLQKPVVRIHLVGITSSGMKYFESAVVGEGSYSTSVSPENQLTAVKNALAQLSMIKPYVAKSVLRSREASTVASVTTDTPIP